MLSLVRLYLLFTALRPPARGRQVQSARNLKNGLNNNVGLLSTGQPKMTNDLLLDETRLLPHIRWPQGRPGI